MTPRGGLRRFVEEPAPQAPQPVEERCELCGTPVEARHGHVVDVEHRSLKCTCRACYLLFVPQESGAGRLRAVPERYRFEPDRPLSTSDWERLGIPVASAFFLRGEDGVRAFYPSPAGATECLLDLEAWAELGREHPMLAAAQPEVEAILIRAEHAGVECYLVPIDVCYQLVGIVRVYWKGFDGGSEARERIDGFFAEVAGQARRFTAEE